MNDGLIQKDGKYYQVGYPILLPFESDNPTVVPFLKMPQTGKLVKHSAGGEFRKYLSLAFKPQHLYIVSDEEIKEGDWCLIDGKHLHKNVENDALYLKEHCKKIIATTDESLNEKSEPVFKGMSGIHEIWKNEITQIGIPSIPNDFLQAYVKAQGKGFEKVLVEVDVKPATFKRTDCKNIYTVSQDGITAIGTAGSVHNINWILQCIEDKNLCYPFYIDSVISILKVAPDNTITIIPFEEKKQNFTREEFKQAFELLYFQKGGGYEDEFNEWFDKNY